MRSWLSLVLATFVVSCGSKHSDLTQSAKAEELWGAVPVGPDGSLGTLGNPVLAEGPFGQHEFLARVRCPDSALATRIATSPAPSSLSTARPIPWT